MNVKGLTAAEVERSRREHGANTLTRIPPDPLWKKILQGLRDPMIMILLVALLIQLILFFCGRAEWYEPAGVLVAILIADIVAAVSESRQEGKASALREEEESRERVKVIRDGVLCEIHSSEVVVGDIVSLQAGDKIPADGELAEGELRVDQATLNGETKEAKKYPPEDGAEYDPRDLLNRHYIYRGTVVCGGECLMEVREVGDRTLFGELALEVQEGTRATPLQVKLGRLAKMISTFGYAGAGAIILSILIKTFITGNTPGDFAGWLMLLVEAVTVAVTIIVCAVPEGLPMLTSILLSYQSLRMAKDNVLVRKINGLETAGSVSILFSDKTGTITEGRLSVEEVTTGMLDTFKNLSEMNPALKRRIVSGIGVNNGAAFSGGKVIGGNSTDRALMSFLADSRETGALSAAEVLRTDPFNSEKKTAAVTIREGAQAVTYIKGAPERILERCATCLNRDGSVRPLFAGDKEKLTAYITDRAGRSMRMLAAAYTEGEDETRPLTLICLLAIRDSVRPEAVEAIREVRHAGVQVVMVTGDRMETAAAIGREAGLLRSDEDLALSSQDLAAMTDEEVKALLPRLCVVARALPTDKSRLVRLAQELDLVVGMTGDGVNDSPALKKADVGFAMGSGTEVAKEAGDITILDDNFASIEKAILYGRTMYKSIRKFLIFQLTVNAAAVLTCFLAPLLREGDNTVLTVIQLLLINLVMDTLAAIAFGSEPPLKEYMKEKPVPRRESIVSKAMLQQAGLAAVYICALCLCIRYVPGMHHLFGIADYAPAAMRTYLDSAVFATFMMAIGFNGFNARTEHLNVFAHLGRNRNFLLVMGGVFLLQYVFVTFGGEVLRVTPLNPRTWLICLIAAFLVIPLDLLRKTIAKSRKKEGEA